MVITAKKRGFFAAVVVRGEALNYRGFGRYTSTGTVKLLSYAKKKRKKERRHRVVHS